MTAESDRPRRGHLKLGFLMGLIAGGLLALVGLPESPAEPSPLDADLQPEPDRSPDEVTP